jgi:hypothetical protein
MNGAQKKSRKSDAGSGPDDASFEPLDAMDATFFEILLIIVIILTLGAALVLHKRRDTSKSYIHPLFSPLDHFLSSPPSK